MQLDKIQIELKPRNAWQAMDLGVAFLKNQLHYLWRPWLFTLSPVFMLGLYILHTEYAYLAVLIMWWLKPLYDRVLLLVFSKTLFAEQPGLKDIVAEKKQILTSGLLTALTLRRFDLGRSFSLPVQVLEGLKGTSYKQRMRLLNKYTRGKASGLTYIAVHIELLINISCYSLLLVLIPSNMEWSLLDILADESREYAASLFNLCIYAFAIFIVDPLYVASGFFLYLNRRTQLEGWDIELAFRSLQNRTTREQVA